MLRREVAKVQENATSHRHEFDKLKADVDLHPASTTAAFNTLWDEVGRVQEILADFQSSHRKEFEKLRMDVRNEVGDLRQYMTAANFQATSHPSRSPRASPPDMSVVSLSQSGH